MCSSGVVEPHPAGVFLRHIRNVKSTISNDSMGAPRQCPRIPVPISSGLCGIDRASRSHPTPLSLLSAGPFRAPVSFTSKGYRRLK